MCHINSLKKYYDPNQSFVSTDQVIRPVCTSDMPDDVIHDKIKPSRLLNSLFLSHLDEKFVHLPMYDRNCLSCFMTFLPFLVIFHRMWR
jgi:hypothetical protein